MLSLADIYQEHKNLVFNLCLKYTLQTEDAQDLTQDVFVKVHQQLHRFDADKASLSTWIYRITVNHCIDVQRRKKRSGFLRFFATTPEDVPDHRHPFLQSDQQEMHLKLMTAIHQLPAKQQTALILAHLEGQSHAQIAGIMQTTSKAVESLIARAKKNLEKKLGRTEG